MKNKEYKTQELVRAGWAQKTPGSGYWHRPGISVYKNYEEAFDDERLFPERVRQTIMKVTGKAYFFNREITNDLAWALHIDEVQNDARKKFDDAMKGIYKENGKDLKTNVGWSSNFPPLKPSVPIQPVPLIESTTITHHADSSATVTHVNKPKFKTTYNGVYWFVVDLESGRSVYRVRGAWGNQLAEKARARYEAGEFTTEIKSFNSRFNSIADIEPTHTNALRGNLNTRIEYLQKIHRELNTHPINWERIKALLTGDTARSTRYELVPTGILAALGLKEK